MSQPELPAPMTSTRLPAKTVALLYSLVCITVPSKWPGKVGTFGSLRVPLATRTPAWVVVRPLAVTCQAPSTGSIRSTSVPKVNPSRRPKWSANSVK